MKKIFLTITVIAITLSANAQSVVAQRAFNTMLKAYFDTKNALAKDNVGEASVNAKNLATSIEEFPVKTLTPAQQELWKMQSEEIKNAANAIVAEKALKEQRNRFWPISTAVIKLVNAFNMNNTTVYVQHCPMAKKSWLNEVEPVQNPFYGSMMYDCGEVTATIEKK